MPVLNEPRYERFAHALASGKSLHLASRLAGFLTPQYTLRNNEIIQQRVAQILEAAASEAVMQSREWQERETRRARVDIREFFDLETGRALPLEKWPDDAVEAIESIEYDKYGQLKIKLAKSSAMNNLGKMHKLLTDKVELNANVNSNAHVITSEMTPQEAAENYALMLAPGK